MYLLNSVMGCISHFIWFCIIFLRKHQSCVRAKHLTQFYQFIVLALLSGNKYLSEFFTKWFLFHSTQFSFVVNRWSRKIVIDLWCDENRFLRRFRLNAPEFDEIFSKKICNYLLKCSKSNSLFLLAHPLMM